MAEQIIRQPDGRYAIFSSHADAFVLIDATAAQVVKHCGRQARLVAEASARKTLTLVQAGQRAYHQFTLTWAEALTMHRDKVHRHKHSAFDAAVEAADQRREATP